MAFAVVVVIFSIAVFFCEILLLIVLKFLSCSLFFVLCSLLLKFCQYFQLYGTMYYFHRDDDDVHELPLPASSKF